MNRNRRSMPGQGLFEQPLIVEGKRTRRSVDRFGTAPTPPVSAQAATSRINGSRVALGDIERVKQEITSMAAAQLKPLHKILFGTAGRVATLKEEIEQFNGFSFPIGSADYEKKRTVLGKLLLEDLRTMSKVLGLDADIPRDHMITAILDFLMTPKQPVELAMPTKPAIAKKRSSSENEIPASKAKKSRESESPPRQEAGLQLSESSSGEDSDGEEDEEPPVKVTTKPKKRVSFEDEHRLVQIGGEPQDDEPMLANDQMTDGESSDDGGIPEDAKQTIQELIEGVADLKKVTLGQIITDTIKRHPDLTNNREVVRDHAIKVLRTMEAPAQ